MSEDHAATVERERAVPIQQIETMKSTKGRAILIWSLEMQNEEIDRHIARCRSSQVEMGM